VCTRILSRAQLIGPHRQVRSTARSASWSCERGLRCVGRSAGVGCVGRVSDICLAASDGCVRAAAEGLFPRTVTCVSGRFRAGSNHRQRSIGRPASTGAFDSTIVGNRRERCASAACGAWVELCRSGVGRGGWGRWAVTLRCGLAGLPRAGLCEHEL
jgi:hypothetical protein